MYDLDQQQPPAHELPSELDVEFAQDVFSWSGVCTEFEMFDQFLTVLQAWNSPGHCFNFRYTQTPVSCSQCKRQCQRLLWSLFGGFSNWQNSRDRGIHCIVRTTTESQKDKIIAYYLSFITQMDLEKYLDGSFFARCRIIAYISKKCPIRLQLLPELHDRLLNSNTAKLCCSTRPSPSAPGELPNGFVYSLFATVLIDRRGVAYLRLRIHTIHANYQTSRLTREYSEEAFLRVSFFHAAVGMDARMRFVQSQESLDLENTAWSQTHSVVHNVSTLSHIIKEVAMACSESDQYESIKLATSEVAYMNDPILSFATRWCPDFVDNIEEQGLLMRQLRAAYRKIFKGGFQIAGRDFRYLMTTSAGIHKNTHIFCSLNTENTNHTLNKAEPPIHTQICRQMFTDFDMNELRTKPLKMSVRMGLWFTPTVSVQLEGVDVKTQPNIGEHTDGCGRLSMDLAEKISRQWNECKQYRNTVFNNQNVGPLQWNENTEHDAEIEYDETLVNNQTVYSAFQVRLEGMKGMLIADPDIPKNTIYPSESQEKFKPPDVFYKNIELIQCSQPMKSARLNFALISLIVGCSMKPNKMQRYLASLADFEVKQLLRDKEYAIQFAIDHNDMKSFNMLGAGIPLKQVFFAGYYQNYARRLKITVPNSRRLYGVADFWNILKQNQVYISVSGIEKITGKVLVTKEPCFYRGDLRCLDAIDDDRFHHLKDVIIFSCDGDRSETDKICGSDLDGDQYFVCWDSNIVHNIHPFSPGNYDQSSDDVQPSYYKVDEQPLFDQDPETPSADVPLLLGDIHFPSQDIVPTDEALKRAKPATRSQWEEKEDEIDEPGWSHQPGEDSTLGTIPFQLTEEFYFHTYSGKAAEAAVGPHGVNIFDASIRELFDMRMRVIDALGSDWTSWEWEILMNRFRDSLSNALDSAKTGDSAPTSKWSPIWFHQKIPKYPHFYPTKRAIECRMSKSAAGYIYSHIINLVNGQTPSLNAHVSPEENTRGCKLLIREACRGVRWQMRVCFGDIPIDMPLEVHVVIQRDDVREKDMKSRESINQTTVKKVFEGKCKVSRDSRNNSDGYIDFDGLLPNTYYHIKVMNEETNKVIFQGNKSIPAYQKLIPDNTDQRISRVLHDAIQQLKLSFLLHYTFTQHHQRPGDSHENVIIQEDFNEPLSNVPPPLSLNNLSDWLKCVLSQNDKDLLDLEATCTTLWKLIIWDCLNGHFSERSTQLQVILISDGLGLNTIDQLTRQSILQSERFICVNNRFRESYNRSNWTNESYQKLDNKESRALIKHLGKCIERSIWKDLKLPYPGFIRRTHHIYGSACTFDQSTTLLNSWIEKCSQRVDLDSKLYRLYIHDKSVRSLLTSLLVHVGHLLCFSEQWHSDTNTQEFLRKMEKICISFLHTCKRSAFTKAIRTKGSTNPTEYNSIIQQHFQIPLSSIDVMLSEVFQRCEIDIDHIFTLFRSIVKGENIIN